MCGRVRWPGSGGQSGGDDFEVGEAGGAEGFGDGGGVADDDQGQVVEVDQRAVGGGGRLGGDRAEQREAAVDVVVAQVGQDLGGGLVGDAVGGGVPERGDAGVEGDRVLHLAVGDRGVGDVDQVPGEAEGVDHHLGAERALDGERTAGAQRPEVHPDAVGVALVLAQHRVQPGEERAAHRIAGDTDVGPPRIEPVDAVRRRSARRPAPLPAGRSAPYGAAPEPASAGWSGTGSGSASFRSSARPGPADPVGSLRP